MNKIISGLLILLFSISINAQQVSIIQPMTGNDYLLKENSKKTIGWVLTGGGAALVVGGVALSSSNPSYFPGETVGTIMIVGGGVAVITGVIILSSVNKNNIERNVSLDLKMERAIVINRSAYKENYFPAAAFKIMIGK